MNGQQASPGAGVLAHEKRLDLSLDRNLAHRVHASFQNPPPTGPEADTPPEATASESAVLRKELVEQHDLNLRLAADFDNFKRRSRQETDHRAAAQKDSFIRELLPALDNLERALSAGASSSLAQFHQGVEMTLQQLRQLLQQHGIEAEESVGQPFDPRRHEAVSQRRDPAQPDHAILEVFRRGYRRGDQVVRPAQVVVNDPADHRVLPHAR